MDAAEARKIAKDLNDDVTKDALASIYRSIKAYAIKGEFTMNYEGAIPKKALDKLKLDGYVVKYDSARNESWYTISWENPIMSGQRD